MRMMKLGVFCLLAIIWMWAPATAQQPAKKEPAEVHVYLETELGTIELTVDKRRAPVTTANFLRYVEGGYYDGGRFHRTVRINPDNQPNNNVKIEVIQAGADPDKAKSGFPPIKLERTNATGLRHRNGVVSMARAGADSATSDFFICIGDQPELDFGGRRNPDGQGFAAFGKVVKGMEIVRKIQEAPAEGQALKPPIRIIKATLGSRRPAARK